MTVRTLPAIEVKNLTKIYAASRPWFSRKPPSPPHLAVDNISFSVPQGQGVGFIGINGAGKSTTIKMLLGVLRPTQGEIRVMGLDPLLHRQRVSAQVAVVFGQRTQLWWDLQVRDCLHFVARLYGMPPAIYQQRLDELLVSLNLEPLMQKPLRHLSLGQKARVEIAAALIHRPRVLYLDEPTIGLDLLAKQQIRKVLREEIQNQGTTIFLTSHDMDDIEQVCSRVIVLSEGQITQDCSVKSLQDQHHQHRLLHVRSLLPLHQLPAHHLCIHTTEDENGCCHVYQVPVQLLPSVTSDLLRHGVFDLEITRLRLEETVLSMYQEPTGVHS